MDQTAETIRTEIDRRREAMTHDVNEIEDRARSMTDWRRQFEERPLMLIAAAFGGGVLLGAVFGGSGDDGDERRQRDQQSMPAYYYQDQGNYGWDRYRTERDASRGNGGVTGWVTGQRGPTSSTDAGKQRAAGKIDEVRGALMGLAATKAEEFLREALPGFDSEVQKVREQRQASSNREEQAQSSQQTSQSRQGVTQSDGPDTFGGERSAR